MAAVAVHREEAAVHAGGGDPVLAVGAGAVAERERRDHQVALGERGHLGTDVLDDADELVADRAGLEWRVAAVVPEIRPAHAGEYDTDDRIGRVTEGWVGPLAGIDPARLVEDGSTHSYASSDGFSSVTSSPWQVSRDTGRPCERGTDRAPLAPPERAYVDVRGRRKRHRRVPHEPPCEGHARAGRTAHLGPAPRQGAAPRGGCLAGRGQRRVLQAPGARQRQRRLRRCARGARAGAAARRRRARAPFRPRPSRQPDRAKAPSPSAATRPAGGPANPRIDRRPGDRAQQPRRLPVRQLARPGAVRAAVRQPPAAGQQRPLHVP